MNDNHNNKDNAKNEYNSDNQKRRNGYHRNSEYNHTKKQVTRQKNNKYKSQTRQNNKNQEKQQKPVFKNTSKNTVKNTVKNTINKTPGRGFQKQNRRGRRNSERLKIIPLGGLEQIGMNITAFEYGESIVVVDCGLSFPEDDMLGIDLVIPDVTYLKENISKVKGFVITHGHEDHIGALPYVLKEVNVPIYSTKLTLGLITNKLKEHNLMRSTRLKEVKHGQVINLEISLLNLLRQTIVFRMLLLLQFILRQELLFTQETLR